MGDIPAAALSALAQAEDGRRALAGGFQMHLAKPVAPAELLTVIVSLAQRQFDLAGNHGRNPG
jgi:CheY-like chemotaxis protein